MAARWRSLTASINLTVVCFGFDVFGFVSCFAKRSIVDASEASSGLTTTPVDIPPRTAVRWRTSHQYKQSLIIVECFDLALPAPGGLGAKSVTAAGCCLERSGRIFAEQMTTIH